MRRRFSRWATATIAIFAVMQPAWATPFINEFHYDNVGTDTGEFIEIAGLAGTDLTGWTLQLYNGNGGALYNTFNLSGTLTDQANGFGFQTVSGPSNSIQNGSPDGIALVDNTNTVIQFLSYEGSFTATNGAANGLTSTDIGVRETSSTPVGFSLQLTGNITTDSSGNVTSDFTWAAPAAQTAGAANIGQTFNGAGGGDSGGGDTGGGNGGTDATVAAIYEIQGASHGSAFDGQLVETSGIVTAIASNGFYVQDANGDGNDATSDAIFVFTGGTPTVAIGDDVSITGTVDEFTPGGASSGNLSITEITSPTITVASSGNSLPPAVIIGSAGRTPPTSSIDSDNFAAFNPNEDGIDFYESLEGMRVTISDAQAVAPTNNFGEIYVVADAGADATGMNDRGGITISDGDLNPERLQIDDSLLTGNSPDVQIGDGLGDVTGVIGYSFGNFELLPTDAPTVTAGGLVAETTSIPVEDDRLTVASFNVENLSAQSGDDKFAALAQQIVDGLRSPDVIGLQEIQDNSGPTNDGVTDASQTYQALIDAIVALGGPQYAFADVAPADGTSGGQPGGNIRTGFLYNPDRVDLVPGSVMAVPGADTDAAFNNSRQPLVATFVFNGQEVTIVNNHFRSKGGSDPLFGSVQPPANGGEDARTAQAQFVHDFIQGLLALNPTANVIALGDLNEFAFLPPLQALAGLGLDQILTDLASLLAAEERYSFIFEGNSQLLDHIFVTDNLLSADVLFDIVHMNAEFLNAFTDHDPLLASFLLPALAVPVPPALLLLLMGLALFAALQRKRLVMVKG
ncbi:endonuclease/exonuclease/phosphatase family protein [Iodidimonas muriae]|nr:endonuclease/exonuclease/phosphatase family protein [Iodidimonas muriae]